MNAKVTSIDAPIQAENWFARLRASDCTAADLAAFERWRDESPGHAAAYRNVERTWRQLDALRAKASIVAATAEAVRAASQTRVVPGTRPRWKWMAAIAAALVVALTLGLLRPWAAEPAGERFATVTGEQRHIQLADGSEVLLDAESELVVHLKDHERDLFLEKGQAQFDVAHDAQRPFIVRAASGAIKALGTEFQVRVDGDDVLVTLLKGKISVDVAQTFAADKSDTLIAGQQIRFNHRHDVWTKKKADIEVAQGWTYGDLVFKQWHLDDLVAEMNRYSDTKIRIADASLAELPVSGRFHAGDHDSLILALEHDWPIVAKQASDGEIALHRRSGG